jgi:hypothetical protein
MITNKTAMNIEDMSESGKLSTVALETAKMYGQDRAYWTRAAELYRLYKQEVADRLIGDELGEEFLLDVEMCEMYLRESGLAK